MISNYKRIGDFIQQIKVKNTEGKFDLLLGINIDKFFMPSVANVIGTDLTKYKVVRKNQFACNRMHVGRDYRIPIALSKKNDPFIVSPAYTVFEIIDTSVLLPEYLMMWFTRSEFDRNAWFHTDADVRGGLPWELFCGIELPIPSIKKQQEIVKEYHTVVSRIKLNEKLNQKLEETAQTLYKHWFIDFEFPNTEGKPYKSNGGKMNFNEGLNKEIPVGLSVENLSHFIEIKYGKDYKHLSMGNIPLYGSGGVMKYVNDILYDKASILIPRKGSLRNILLIDEPFWSVDTMFYSKMKEKYCRYYIYYYLCGIDFYALNHGAAVPSTTAELLNNLQVIKPKEDKLKIFKSRVEIFFNQILKNKKQSQKLKELQSLLLAKMTKVEIEKEKVS